MASTYREFFATALSPRWARGYFGERWMGLKALLLDVIAEGFSEALRAPDLYRDAITDDALDLDGYDLNMPRYATETAAQYLARLKTAWATWQSAGSKTAIETQFTLAGFTATVYTPKRTHPVYGTPHGEWVRPPYTHPIDGTLWWSRFWVVIDGPHPQPYSWPKWGTFTWGAFTWGFSNASGFVDLQSILRGIVRHWKAAHIVCQEIFLLGDTDTPMWGHNMTWGSFTWGAGTNGKGIASFPG